MRRRRRRGGGLRNVCACVYVKEKCGGVLFVNVWRICASGLSARKVPAWVWRRGAGRVRKSRVWLRGQGGGVRRSRGRREGSGEEKGWKENGAGLEEECGAPCLSLTKPCLQFNQWWRYVNTSVHVKSCSPLPSFPSCHTLPSSSLPCSLPPSLPSPCQRLQSQLLLSSY